MLDFPDTLKKDCSPNTSVLTGTESHGRATYFRRPPAPQSSHNYKHRTSPVNHPCPFEIKKVPHFQKSMKPFPTLKNQQPQRLRNPTVANTQQADRGVWIFSINSGHVFTPCSKMQCNFTEVLCRSQAVFCVLWFYYSLFSLKRQAQLKLKIYVEVNRNGTDLMGRKYRIDTFADTNGIKNVSWTLAVAVHICTRGWIS